LWFKFKEKRLSISIRLTAAFLITAGLKAGFGPEGFFDSGAERRALSKRFGKKAAGPAGLRGKGSMERKTG